MAKRKTIEVFKDGGVWIAQKQGAARASAVRNTQKEAYLAARSIALNQGLTITVYRNKNSKGETFDPKNTSDEENCFITTACVKHYNLDDNCYQLRTLRNFRDTYLLKSLKNKQLVEEYYSIAPRLVRQLKTDKNKNR